MMKFQWCNIFLIEFVATLIINLNHHFSSKDIHVSQIKISFLYQIEQIFIMPRQIPARPFLKTIKFRI